MASLKYGLTNEFLNFPYRKITYHKIHRRKVYLECVFLNGKLINFPSHSFCRKGGSCKGKACFLDESFRESLVGRGKQNFFDIPSKYELFCLQDESFHDLVNQTSH